MQFPRPAALAASLVLLGSTIAAAQIPPGYYSSVDATNPTTLRQTLHLVIDDHTRFPYTSSSTDTWDILELAMEDPNNASRIIDVYRNSSLAKQGGGNSFYDREHSWPKSYGFPDDGSGNYPYTDCHLLFLANGAYNSARSNKPFRFCSSSCTEYVTDPNGGAGGGSGSYPGNSNWTSGSLTAGTWETWIGRRGDVARAMLYADIRYEGGTHGVTAHPEPDLIVTDSEALIISKNTGNNESTAYMGILQDLLVWHQQDPVDAAEMQKNDVVYAFQGNRNPFVDHPEWVACLFSANCGTDTTPPVAPTGLGAAGGNTVVTLGWNDNTEIDLSGYNVYRSTGGGFVLQNVGLVPTSDYVDTNVTNGTTYTYQVTAQDAAGNESTASASAVATPMAGGASATPWINEFHYDNTGADTGEFIEVAGPAGTDLSGWSIVAYNGNGGAAYNTINLSGVMPNQQAQVGTLAFPFSSLQNGSPDGIALVDGQGAVIQFLSYEGGMTAADGPASGMMSTDVGVSESSATPVGFSLQLAGTGASYVDFTWLPAAAETPGQPNQGQTFSGLICQTDLGFGNHATAVLSACGQGLASGQTSVLSLAGVPPTATLYLAASLQNNPVSVFELDGSMLVPVPILVFTMLPNPGTGTLSFPVPGGGGPVSIFAQYILTEPSAPTKTSNALRLDLQS